MLIALLSLVPFALALLMAVPAIRSGLRQIGMTWSLTAVMAILFVIYLTFFPTVAAEGAQIYTLEWVPQLGLNLTWYLDGLSLLFALVITGIGTCIVLYAGYYFEEDGDQEIGRFYMYLMGFTGAMLTLVTAGNVLMMFVAWELTSVFSFMLISFKGGKGGDKYSEAALAARQGAIRALIVTGGGGLALIAGLVIMGVAGGSYEWADILTNPELVEHPWYIGFTFLVMLGAFTKSAQVPFHFWLPGGMSAPSPASAFLHSATMVKAGIYLLARLYPTLGDTSFWLNVVMGVGLTTMVVGAVFAVGKRDLKAVLAYSTVSKLGAIVAMLGLPNGIGIKAAMVGILAHALYKATFFLLAGVVEHSTGTRNLDQLGGLWSRMRPTAIIAWTVALSMAGFPPLLGFVAKETLIDANLPVPPLTIIPVIAVTVASILTVVVAFMFAYDVFFGEPRGGQDYHHFHAPSWGLLAGPAILATLSLVFGIFVQQIIKPFIEPAVGKEFSLYLFPPDGFANPAFQISIFILVVGPILFAVRRYWTHLVNLPLPTFTQGYNAFIRAIEWSGDQLLRTQGGKLRYYLIVIMGSVLVFIVLAQLNIGDLLQLSTFTLEFDNLGVTLLDLLLLGVAVAATFASVVFKRQLLAALALGVAGYAIGGIFLLEPAPDVALVQVLVETFGTVLIILMIARIPPKQREAVSERLWATSRRGIVRDLVISIGIGTAVGLFALTAVVNRPTASAVNEPIANWHITHTYVDTGANDVVAAILADFRGIDTLLEITVLSLAALGVATLLTRPESRELIVGKRVTQVRMSIPTEMDDPSNELEALQDERAKSRLSTPLTRMVASLVLPLALLVSLSHVLYGGIGPGDGFTAGVVSGLAIALWYVVFGYFNTRERLRWLVPGRLIAVGLAISMLNAIFPLLLNEPFFAHLTIGNGSGPAGTHLASTLFFEVGIFITVFGCISLIIEAIAYPKEIEGLGEVAQ